MKSKLFSVIIIVVCAFVISVSAAQEQEPDVNAYALDLLLNGKELDYFTGNYRLLVFGKAGASKREIKQDAKRQYAKFGPNSDQARRLKIFLSQDFGTWGNSRLPTGAAYLNVNEKTARYY